MNIRKFKKGQEIVRIEAANRGDRSYIGQQFIFVGIANGCIYVEHVGKPLFGDKIIDLQLDWWSEGWELWVDPNSLKDGYDYSNESKDQLRKSLETAIKEERYEDAGKIRDLLYDKL